MGAEGVGGGAERAEGAPLKRQCRFRLSRDVDSTSDFKVAEVNLSEIIIKIPICALQLAILLIQKSGNIYLGEGTSRASQKFSPQHEISSCATQRRNLTF